MATPSPSDQLDTTLRVLRDGLLHINDVAKNDLAGWTKALHGNKDLAPVAESLQKLQDAIAANHHGTIADTISLLSEQTKQAAVHATPDTQSRLYQLSDVLKMAAGQVGA